MRLPVSPCAALASAALYGASVPLLKPFTENLAPQSLACALYLGAALGLGCIAAIRLTMGTHEARLSKRDIPRLLAGTLLGSVAANSLLIVGLSHTNSAYASLLLTLSDVLAAAFAWMLFRERASRRAIVGMSAVVAGAIMLAHHTGGNTATNILGPLCITGACVLWGLDGNIMRSIAASDPIHIAGIRTLLAGSINLSLVIGVTHSRVPDTRAIVIVGLIGFFCYGLSIVFALVALRRLGVARSSIYFATAPFIGVAIAQINGMGESGWEFAAAALLMAAGICLHLTERQTASTKTPAFPVIATSTLQAET